MKGIWVPLMTNTSGGAPMCWGSLPFYKGAFVDKNGSIIKPDSYLGSYQSLQLKKYPTYAGNNNYLQFTYSRQFCGVTGSINSTTYDIGTDWGSYKYDGSRCFNTYTYCMEPNYGQVDSKIQSPWYIYVNFDFRGVDSLNKVRGIVCTEFVPSYTSDIQEIFYEPLG